MLALLGSRIHAHLSAAWHLLYSRHAFDLQYWPSLRDVALTELGTCAFLPKLYAVSRDASSVIGMIRVLILVTWLYHRYLLLFLISIVSLVKILMYTRRHLTPPKSSSLPIKGRASTRPPLLLSTLVASPEYFRTLKTAYRPRFY